MATPKKTRLTDRQRELVSAMRVGDDNRAVFPGEQIPDWPALKKVMEALGGTWKRGTKGDARSAEEGLTVGPKMRAHGAGLVATFAVDYELVVAHAALMLAMAGLAIASRMVVDGRLPPCATVAVLAEELDAGLEA